MANLKVDLANKVNNDKYFAEMELIRLAQEPNMNYEEKIKLMDEKLTIIVGVERKLELINAYFSAPEENAPDAPVENTPLAQPNGQSHGE